MFTASNSCNTEHVRTEAEWIMLTLQKSALKQAWVFDLCFVLTIALSQSLVLFDE